MRERLEKEIIDIETEMFRGLNIGEPMPEDRIKPFRMMRWMTYSVLAEETLESWLSDLKEAQQERRNVLTEKYARIENLIPQIKNNPVIFSIVDAEVQWMEELHRRYPHMIKREQANADLFKKYAMCELETWSDRSIALYYRDVCAARMAGKNLPEERYNNMYRRPGQGTLAELESKAAN